MRVGLFDTKIILLIVFASCGVYRKTKTPARINFIKECEITIFVTSNRELC